MHQCAPKNQSGQEIGILSTHEERIECALPNYGFVENQFLAPNLYLFWQYWGLQVICQFEDIFIECTDRWYTPGYSEIGTLNIVPYGLICFVNKYENLHDTGQ